MNTKSYNKNDAVAYAKKWALSRNPKYYNFDPVGGDCTSFVSQCLFAGSQKMNYDSKNPWFYTNGYNKSPSWSGVEYLYNFLIKNKSHGPRGKEVLQSEIEAGDVVQLSFSGNKFEHSLLLLDPTTLSVAAHTYDVLGKKLNDYDFAKVRFVHIIDIGI